MSIKGRSSSILGVSNGQSPNSSCSSRSFQVGIDEELLEQDVAKLVRRQSALKKKLVAETRAKEEEKRAKEEEMEKHRYAQEQIRLLTAALHQMTKEMEDMKSRIIASSILEPNYKKNGKSSEVNRIQRENSDGTFINSQIRNLTDQNEILQQKTSQLTAQVALYRRDKEIAEEEVEKIRYILSDKEDRERQLVQMNRILEEELRQTQSSLENTQSKLRLIEASQGQYITTITTQKNELNELKADNEQQRVLLKHLGKALVEAKSKIQMFELPMKKFIVQQILANTKRQAELSITKNPSTSSLLLEINVLRKSSFYDFSVIHQIQRSTQYQNRFSVFVGESQLVFESEDSENVIKAISQFLKISAEAEGEK